MKFRSLPTIVRLPTIVLVAAIPLALWFVTAWVIKDVLLASYALWLILNTWNLCTRTQTAHVRDDLARRPMIRIQWRRPFGVVWHVPFRSRVHMTMWDWK